MRVCLQKRETLVEKREKDKDKEKEWVAEKGRERDRMIKTVWDESFLPYPRWMYVIG